MALSADEFFDSELEIGDSNNGDGIITPIGMDGQVATYGIEQANKTTKKDYRAAYIYINVTSYSQRQVLRKCSRAFQILKTPAVTSGAGLGLVNLDFVFGHSVGAGVQTYLVTRSKKAALWASFLAWTAPLDSQHERKKKASWWAALAVEKFIYYWEQNFADKWELAHFKGKPACELTFLLDTENGYYHAGHIDAVLRHRVTGRYMVLEIKSTAIRTVDEAQYGNSEQSLGYSVVLDKVVEDLKATALFEVLYLVYSSTNREWTGFPFTKSRTHRMEWLQELLLDHTFIGTYRNLGYFPKNGDSCWSFNSRCPHYSVCDLKSMQRTDFKVLELAPDGSNLPEPVDFQFKLSELTNAALRGGAQNGTEGPQEKKA